MVMLARLPGLNKLSVQLRPSWWRMGPLISIKTPTELVTAETSWMQLGSWSNMTSKVAKITGKYAGKHPAMTALAAACSAVSERRRTGTSPRR